MILEHGHEFFKRLIAVGFDNLILLNFLLSDGSFVGHIVESTIGKLMDGVSSKEVSAAHNERNRFFNFLFEEHIANSLNFVRVRRIPQLLHDELALSERLSLPLHSQLILLCIQVCPSLLSVLCYRIVLVEALCYMLHEV